jgi:monoterpene epsilon-lactone hydrolase
MKIRDEGLRMPSCGVCFSGWTDLTGSGDSVKKNADRDQMFYPNTIDQFANAYTSDGNRQDPLASPVFGDFADFPPILFHVGSTELLVDDSRRPHEAIRMTGGNSILTVFEGVSHGWQMGAGLIPEANRSLLEAAEFIKMHCGQSLDR